MSKYAELDATNTVTRVIVAEQDFIATQPGRWVQYLPMHKNYPGPGYIYDEQREEFIPPMPEGALRLDEATLNWIVPEGEGL